MAVPMTVTAATTRMTRTSDDGALTLTQCVAKRRRQLERLEFALHATARQLTRSTDRESSAPRCDRLKNAQNAVSATAVSKARLAYVHMLLDALAAEEQQVSVQQRFCSALPLEVTCSLMRPM